MSSTLFFAAVVVVASLIAGAYVHREPSLRERVEAAVAKYQFQVSLKGSPLRDADWHGRERELQAFRGILEDPRPEFSLVTGPPSAGKSQLFMRILKNRRLIHFDLRQANLHFTPGDLAPLFRVVRRRFVSFAATVLNGTADAPLDTLFTLFRQIEAAAEWTPLLHDMTDFLDITQRLWPSELLPVVWIDEASLLEVATHSGAWRLLNWFIKVSKQDRLAHVLLTATDASAQDWLDSQVSSTQYRTYGLGFLDRAESVAYIARLGLSDPALQEAVYEVYGGKARDLANVVPTLLAETFNASTQTFDVPRALKLVRTEHELVAGAVGEVQRWFGPESYLKYHHTARGRPLWTPAQLESLLRALVEHNGVLPEKAAVAAVESAATAAAPAAGTAAAAAAVPEAAAWGAVLAAPAAAAAAPSAREVLSSLVRYEVLVSRPVRRFSFDLPTNDSDDEAWPVVTAPSPLFLHVVRAELLWRRQR